MNGTDIRLHGMARRLVEQGQISQEQAEQAIVDARDAELPFITHIVRKQLVDGAEVARRASQDFGYPLFDLRQFEQDMLPKGVVENKLIIKHHVLPLFKRGKKLFVALSDPTNLQALNEIKFHTGLSTDAVLVNDSELSLLIDSFTDSQDAGMESELGDLDDSLENLEVDTTSPAEEEDTESAANNAPVVKFVNKMLLDAIRQGASDIHFEPYEKVYRVRFRTDGMLEEVSRPPVSIGNVLAARLKVMSQMDISERRVPQDGRIKMRLSKNRTIDFRVNTLPTLWGEKIVLRILDPSSAQMGIDHLGYEPEQKDLYMKALNQPQGMILVTGPTGSGKTVSLYTGLNILNTVERNISTAEDPVEINLEGVNQVHVNAKVGLTFAEALRSFLRQDPDIVMVGEIRDLETAEISIKAAQTGHLVLSTLHTNSAAETVTRLLNMGVPAFNVASSVSLIIAQRLARRLCQECAEPANIPVEALLEQGFTEEILETANILKPVGCDKCNNGNKGRVGIYEVVRITEELATLIMEGANSLQLAKKAREEGFADLRHSALKKCADGLISLEEVNRITKD